MEPAEFIHRLPLDKALAGLTPQRDSDDQVRKDIFCGGFAEALPMNEAPTSKVPTLDAPPRELGDFGLVPQARDRMPARRQGLPRGYLAMWSALSGVAGLYIFQVGLQSVDLPQLLVQTPVEAASSGPPAVSDQLQLKTLRLTLAGFQGDIGRLRLDLESRGEASSLVASLTAIEERMAASTGLPPVKSAATVPPPAPAPVAAASPEPVAAPAPVQTAAVASPAPLQPTTDARRPITLAPPDLEQLLQPIETGSITIVPPAKFAGQLPKATPGAAKALATPGAAAPTAAATTSPAVATDATVALEAAPIAFGPAVVKVAPKPFAVQLASGSTLDSVKLSWSLLSDQYADTLGKLSPRVTQTGTRASGEIYDLLAGPFKTAADARKACKSLAARGTDCKVSPFGGEAF